jgi:hypothetical protein
MGNWFSSSNDQQEPTGGFADVSTLNLTDSEKIIFNNIINQKGGSTKYDENIHLKYDIFKILADMENSENPGMSGGGNNSDTVTNHEDLILKIKSSFNKAQKMKGGSNDNYCGCNVENPKTKPSTVGGADLNDVKIVRDLVKNEINSTNQTGGKKNKKNKKLSSSTSSDSLSSSSSSLSTTSTSSSESDSKTPLSTSVGGDGSDGINIFPFNSTTNTSLSEKNFRLLRRNL